MIDKSQENIVHYPSADGYHSVQDSILLESMQELRHTGEHEPGESMFFRELSKRGVPGSRFFDVVLSLIILMLSLPLIPLIWFGVKLTSRGPGFVRLRIMGFRGKPFTGFAFRTYEFRKRTDSMGLVDEHDLFPSITSFGKLLRYTGIYRMPLLFNVLFGQMSLVGGTLVTEQSANRLNNQIRWYYKVFATKPGIFSAAEVNGARSYEPDIQMAAIQSAYDIRYVVKRSPTYYIKILFCGLLGIRLNERIDVPTAGEETADTIREPALRKNVTYHSQLG